MDYSIAKMTCVLKANMRCATCQGKVHEVLQNIHGVYSISIDSEQRTVKISGKVNPNTILMVLEGSGRHAEVKSVRFDGQVMEEGYDYYGESGYTYPPYPSYPPYPYPMPPYPPYAMPPYPYPPFGEFEYPWHNPNPIIMMPLSPPPPPPLPWSSMPSQPQVHLQSQSQSLPPPPQPPPGDGAKRAMISEVSSDKKKCKGCIIM